MGIKMEPFVLYCFKMFFFLKKSMKKGDRIRCRFFLLHLNYLGLPTIVWVKRDRDQVHQSETLSHSGNARYS